MADKKTKDTKAESKPASKPSEVKLNINFRRMAVHAQTKLFTLGMALPLGLIWLGTYIMFSLPALLTQIESYLKNFPADKAPWLYANVLLPMNVNSGLDFYILGIVLYIVALLVARALATRFQLSELKLGDVRVRSLLMALLVSFMVAAVFVSLANRVLFDPLLALQAA